MTGSRRRRWSKAGLAAAVAATFAATSTNVSAQTRPPAQTPAGIARDAALQRLANRLNLPLVDEAVAIFSTQLRRTLPVTFVESIGDNVNLGDQWQRGNPAFDEAVRRTDVALAAEEARGGPLLKLERSDLLYAVNIPWSADDIAFVDRTLDTLLGHEAERAIDAKAAQQTIATLRRRVARGAAGDAIRRSFADLDARAQAQFGDASLMLLAVKGSDPVGATRLQRLVESVTVLPSDAIGQRIVERVSQRLLDAATAYLPQLIRDLSANGR